MTPTVLLAFCTCPDQATADRIANALVGNRLAACVSQIPGLTSTYEWQGSIARDAEVLLMIKTSQQRFDALAEALRELHPYDLPEIIATPVTRGLPEYLQWVCTCTADDA